MRFLILAGVWLFLDGGNPAGLVVGAPVALGAAVASRGLVPPGSLRVRVVPLFVLLGYCLRESVTAGVDVAVRALRPGLPVSPGFVRVPCAIPRGPRRNLLAAAASLMPGSLPVGDSGDAGMVLHVLDNRRPAQQQAARLEELVRAAFGGHA